MRGVLLISISVVLNLLSLYESSGMALTLGAIYLVGGFICLEIQEKK